MFRPGENYIYDILMMIVRFWWGVTKVVGFIVVYFMRNRPPNLQQSEKSSKDKVPTISESSENVSNQNLLQIPNGWRVLGIICFVPGSMLLLAVPQYALFSLILIGAGLYFIAKDKSSYLAKRLQAVSNHDLSQQSAEEKEEASLDAEVQSVSTITVYSIQLPRQTSWNAETALHFVKQLSVSLPQLLLSITADHQRIVWQIIDANYGIDPNVVEQLVRTSYPQAEIESTFVAETPMETPFYRYLCEYRQLNMFVAPLAYVDSFKAFDPINALSQAMNSLQPGERVSYVLALAGNANEAYKQGERLITQSTIHPLQFLARGGVEDAAVKILTKRDRMDKYEYRDQKVLEDKLRESLLYASLWIQVDAVEAVRIGRILGLLDAQMPHFTRDPFNALSWVERPLGTYTDYIDTPDRDRDTNFLTKHRQRPLLAFGNNGTPPPVLILEPREIAALWHFPAENFSASRIGWARHLKDVPEVVARLDNGITLGNGKYQGKDVLVRLPHADRVTHLNIVGRTGTGKSTLLHHLIHQDIHDGSGVAVIDPHGKLVRDILRSSIPTHREADVVVLDLANTNYPPPINPLRGVQGYTNTLKMVGVIERLFAGTEGAARMASYLRAALLPLSGEAQATMRDVTRIFMDDIYREQRLTAVDDPETLDFWDYQYNHATPAMQRQIADPIINRIRPFYANPTLYPILCHPDHFDLSSLMQQKKIVLISLALDEEQVPEQERNLIGALLMSQLQMASMKTHRQETFHLYVDEVQRFVTTSLSEMLSEARKYGLSLTTANQYLGQLTGKTLEAVMGNVGTSIVFRCSPDDARDLAAYTKPAFDAQALMDLDRFQAVVKLQVQGQTQSAFNLCTALPLEESTDAIEREARIRQQSIARYTPKCREEVIAWLQARYPRRRVTVAPGNESTEESTFYE